MSFEKLLIFHCSPTLASIKTANLFSFHYESDTDLKEHVNYWDFQMREKGVRLTVMRNRNQKALIYVYRTSELEKILGDESTRSFLDRYGYKGLSLEESLERLRKRLEQQEGFPHEIGIFLGYPLEDVAGFICNEGKNFLLSGLWKVYGNLEETRRAFGRLKKCTDIYMRMWNKGKSIQQLTVAA